MEYFLIFLIVYPIMGIFHYKFFRKYGFQPEGRRPGIYSMDEGGYWDDTYLCSIVWPLSILEHGLMAIMRLIAGPG